MNATTALLVTVTTIALCSCSRSDKAGRADAETLKAALLPRALAALNAKKEFVALAGAVTKDGSLTEIVSPPSNRKQNREDEIESLIGVCRRESQSGSIRACAVLIKSGPIPNRGIEFDALWFAYDSQSLYTGDLVYGFSSDSKGLLSLKTPVAVNSEGFVWGPGKWK